MTTTTYRTSPIKRRRRTKREIEALCVELYQIVRENRPATVRQIYYQAVSRGLIDKTEVEYKNVVCRLLANMRRAGTLPYEWLSDETRWMRKPRTYAGMAAFLDHSQKLYRRDLWDGQDVRCEVWLEKDALAGVLDEVTWEWDVPLMVTRGFPSLSYVFGAAEAISASGKPTFIHYFGDHDPSGRDIPRFVEQTIRELAPDAEVHFERVAVTPEQIEEFNLPTRPTKKTDSRSKGFEGESVEVDAIPPKSLQALCRSCIERHIDPEVLNRVRTAEAAERQTLNLFIEGFINGMDK